MWQALHEELEPLGLSVVTVALDLDPEKARPWIDAASPTHPSLIDSQHRIDELLGISNVPMAVWIDETGTLVRPAEGASIQPSPFAAIDITDEMPDRLQAVLREFKQMPETGPAYRAAIVDWAHHGADSPYAMSPDEVIAA
ncbi:MAG: TlpA family protein disulfide reductase, partial [Acidimicrobiales bacterium]